MRFCKFNFPLQLTMLSFIAHAHLFRDNSTVCQVCFEEHSSMVKCLTRDLCCVIEHDMLTYFLLSTGSNQEDPS